MEELIWKLLPSVLMAVFGLWLKKSDDKRSKKAEEHQIQSVKWLKNVADCITANNKGTIALAIAYQEGNKNGKLSSAMELLEESNMHFENFIKDIGYNHLAKG